MGRTRWWRVLVALVAGLALLAAVAAAAPSRAPAAAPAFEGFAEDDAPAATPAAKAPAPAQAPKTPAAPKWDDDEFEGLRPDAPAAPVPAPAAATAAAPKKKDGKAPKAAAAPRPPLTPKDFVLEMAMAVLLVLYAVNWAVGRAQNAAAAAAWAAEFCAPGGLFARNFAAIALAGDAAKDSAKDSATDSSPDAGTVPRVLARDSDSVFKFYASGRRHCTGLHASLDLVPRQDLLSRLLCALGGAEDTIEIEVGMADEAMEPCVLAVSTRKAALRECVDLRELARVMDPESRTAESRTLESRTLSGAKPALAPGLTVWAESAAVADTLLDDAVLELVLGSKAFPTAGAHFRWLHFSDAKQSTPSGGVAPPAKLLRFKFALPHATRMGELTKLTEMALYYIDAVARLRLGPAAKAKALEARQRQADEAEKEERKKAAEAKRKAAPGGGSAAKVKSK